VIPAAGSASVQIHCAPKTTGAPSSECDFQFRPGQPVHIVPNLGASVYDIS